MKFVLASVFMALAATTGRVFAALNCDIQISRSNENSPVCAHFQGVQAGPYHQWYDDNGIEGKYTGSVYLQGSDPSQPENGAAIHWKVDGQYVQLAVAARATGWLGFGIAEAGGMNGADMALFEAAKPEEIVDAHTDDTRSPITDDCPSDWELISSSVDDDGGFIMIELRRLLNTDDPQDKPLRDDSATLIPATRVIAAWGDSPEVSYHGLNRARGAIRFFGSGDDKATFDQAMETQAEGSFIVASVEREIKAQETEYAYTCVSRDDLIEQGVLNTTDLLSIIGFEPLIQEGNEAYVHHYILSGSSLGECDGEDFSFGEVVYVWAPGEGALSFPDYLGSPLLGDDGFSAFKIEVHYNNPQLTPGIIDNSGVRVFWTSQPRDEQIGILSTGDPTLSLLGQAVGNGFSVHSFECPGTCSEVAGEPVTVLREYLHMHETGARMVNEQIRNGDVIRQASVEYWEFDQNGNAAVQQDPFEIQPGDGFKTTCFYNGQDRVFGLASAEEMCMTFLYYYPRIKIFVEEMNFEFPWTCGFNLGFPPCDTTHETQMLSSVDELGRGFGLKSEGMCDQGDDPSTTAPVLNDSGDESSAGHMVTHAATFLMIVLGSSLVL